MSGICGTCKIKSRCISPEGGLLACPLYEQDRKSRWFELFGTPERAARTVIDGCGADCVTCLLPTDCPCNDSFGADEGDYDKLLEWLRGEGEC